MEKTPTEQRPTKAEREAYEAGFRTCCLANGIPYVSAETGWQHALAFRIEIRDREAEYLFPDHADELARHITEELQKAYEKYKREEPLDTGGNNQPYPRG